MRNTPCECRGPGWCVRHQCHKPEHLFQGCRRNQTMFQQWEDGEGPCMPLPDDSPDPNGVGEMPGLARRIINFGAATIRHAASGFQQVSDTIRDARLAICRECPSCNVEQMICREQSCGCYLEMKANWASEACPLGKWPNVPGESE